MFNRQQQYRTGNSANNRCCGWGHRSWGSHWAKKMQGFRRVPANIEETDDSFIISLYAPGLTKEHISLAVKDDVLEIAYKGTDDEQGDNYMHREFTNSSFERSFLLNNKVTTENISAAYTDGILKVTLPRNPETNQPAQQINVG